MKLSYEAILRCSSANSEPMQESAINTAEEAQVFADTAMRIASDRIGRWAQRPRSKISTFSEFLFSKSSQFMILDVAEGRFLLWSTSNPESANGYRSLY